MSSVMLRFILLMTIGCAFAAQLKVVRVARRKRNERFKFAPFPLCVRGNMQFSAYVKQSSPNKVFMEAHNEHNSFSDSYEVQGFTVNHAWTHAQLVQHLNGQHVCQSFNSQKLRVQRTDYYIVEYLKGPNDMWCDAYEGSALRSTDSDRCPGLLNDYHAMADPIYNSVDTPLQSKRKLNTKPMHAVRTTKVWTPCVDAGRRDLADHELCADPFTGVRTSITFYCKKEDTRALGYKIEQWFKGHQLSSYTLPNSENLGSSAINRDVASRMCRLFRFAKERAHDQYIYVQYLHERKLQCEKFRYLSHGNGNGEYMKERGAGSCKRYFQGQRVK